MNSYALHRSFVRLRSQKGDVLLFLIGGFAVGRFVCSAASQGDSAARSRFNDEILKDILSRCLLPLISPLHVKHADPGRSPSRGERIRTGSFVALFHARFRERGVLHALAAFGRAVDRMNRAVAPLDHAGIVVGTFFLPREITSARSDWAIERGRRRIGRTGPGSRRGRAWSRRSRSTGTASSMVCPA